MQRIMIDTDPGVDDAHAILLAYSYQGVRIEAILTVNGNVGLEQTTTNACTILDLLDQDTPIFAGCNAPLVMPAQENAANVHGADGMGDIGYPRSQRRVEKEHAANAIVRLANEFPREIDLVCIAPLTNVALALRLDPELPNKINKLTIMGGAIHGRGNTPNLSAEFNIYTDPEAAYAVLNAWHEYTLISWETSMAYGFNAEILNRWSSFSNRKADFFNKTNEKVISYITQLLGRKMLFAPDALAMAVALEPGIIKKSEKHALAVELCGQHTRGQTTVDWFNFSGNAKKANLILEIDQARFNLLMENALR